MSLNIINIVQAIIIRVTQHMPQNRVSNTTTHVTLNTLKRWSPQISTLLLQVSKEIFLLAHRSSLKLPKNLMVVWNLMGTSRDTLKVEPVILS